MTQMTKKHKKPMSFRSISDVGQMGTNGGQMVDSCLAICPRISDRQMVCVYVIHTICPLSEWLPCVFF